ncbi:S41 family peptidase [Labilibacter marinus]|uniref:S41 family peptidase n=1 Tax=Labilibacter marinus TaxID=1477105 RepID=UPI00082D0419|nr:S41 family peptidase [Labilibacter marinus]
MRRYITFLILLIAVNYSCTKDIVDDRATYVDVFDSFWHIMDERYVFFEEKNVDWDSVYEDYKPKFKEVKYYHQAIDLFEEIILELNDGHISVTTYWHHVISVSGIDTLNALPYLNYEKIYERYQLNNIREYPKVHIGQLNNSITYLRPLYGLDKISSADVGLANYEHKNGVILDLRDCMGGNSEGLGLLDGFFEGNKDLYYRQYKNGKEHHNFTKKYSVKLEGLGTVSSETPIVVLINDNTYSMGNFMASVMKDITACKLVGQKTGGGGGCVISVYLNGGWSLTYTFDRVYNLSGELIEDGILPDIEVLKSKDFWENDHQETGEDPQLEKALEVLLF